MTLVLPLLVLIAPRVFGLAIDAKIDLPSPALASNDNTPISLDSSLSPKIVKAFYEINFVPVAKPDKSHLTITDSKGCPYPKDLCKYYFAPTKVSLVQRVEEIIEESKKDSDVPVVQGIAVTDEEKLLKELSPTINTHIRQNKGIPRKNVAESDVPIYRGTVNVEGVLKRPEVSSLPEYVPRYPQIKRSCLQGACWTRS